MGSSTNVWILGGYQSDFSRNLTREGLDFADLTGEVVDSTLAAAGLTIAFGLIGTLSALGQKPAPVLRHL